VFEPRTDRTIEVPDGRTLAFAEWGDLDGQPVLFLHGSPHSRLWCPDVGATEAVGCRLITLDRPGFGGSDAPAELSLRGWTADVTGLADALGIERLAVVGWSAGGKYAAACAAAIPDRLISAGEVAGAIDRPEGKLPSDDDLTDDGRRVHELARHDPQAARELAAELGADWVAAMQQRPDSLIDGPLPHADLRHFDDADWAADFFHASREGLRQGTAGDSWEWTTRLCPWGFALEDIAIEFHMWHGGQDPLETMASVDYWASRIPQPCVTVWEDAGHLVVTEHWTEILTSLLP
jgi:pimeloyl-ACP methyl ester carboxylesterase